MAHPSNHSTSAEGLWRGPKPACDFCRRRKERCAGGIPCKNCSSRNMECTYESVAPAQRAVLGLPKPAVKLNLKPVKSQKGPKAKVRKTRRGAITAMACEDCRARRKKCTGEQPCKSCTERNEVCVYSKTRRVPSTQSRNSSSRWVPDSDNDEDDNEDDDEQNEEGNECDDEVDEEAVEQVLESEAIHTTEVIDAPDSRPHSPTQTQISSESEDTDDFDDTSSLPDPFVFSSLPLTRSFASRDTVPLAHLSQIPPPFALTVRSIISRAPTVSHMPISDARSERYSTSDTASVLTTPIESAFEQNNRHQSPYIPGGFNTLTTPVNYREESPSHRPREPLSASWANSSNVPDPSVGKRKRALWDEGDYRRGMVPTSMTPDDVSNWLHSLSS